METPKQALYKEDPPLISVVTLSYNSPYLLQAVASALTQTYPAVEYIISDDGSERFPEREIRAYFSTHAKKEWMLRILRNPQNLGTVKNANQAFRAASGKYVFALSADDVFVDDAVLSRWIDAFERSGKDILVGIAAHCDNSLTRRYRTVPNRTQIKWIQTLSSEQLYQKLCPRNFIIGCSTARTKESLQKYGYFDERYRLLEDYPNILSLLRQGASVGVFEHEVVKYREGGVTGDSRFHDTYMADSDLLYQLEQSQYANRPQAVNRMYKQWRADKLKRGEVIRAYHNVRKDPLRFLGVCLRYPRIALQQACGHAGRSVKRIIKADCMRTGGCI